MNQPAPVTPKPVTKLTISLPRRGSRAPAVKMNVATDTLEGVTSLVPSMRAPTISKLFGDNAGYAVETVIAKAQINTLIPTPKEAGATNIIELPLSKIVR